MDIHELTDKGLADMLKSRGVDVGPILASTRRVYEKKLQRMIAEENGSEGDVVQQLQETYEEEEQVEEYDAANADTQPVEYISQPTYRSISPSRQQRSSPSRQARQSPARPTPSYRSETIDDSSRHYGEDITLTRRTLRTTASSTTSSSSRATTHSTSQPAQQAKPKKRSGLSICVQVAIFVIVAVLIYLVIMNMEPAAKDPIKHIEP